jgi:ankyrin repeat protein
MRIRRLIAVSSLLVLLSAGLANAGMSDVADAAMQRNLAALRALLQQKADVNAPQLDGATALHWAVRWDDLEAAELLIRAGANVRASNRFAVTPMSLASLNGSAAMIEKLLKAGVDANSALSELGETPLMMAARTGKLDAVNVLLDHGAAVNARESSQGHTALMWAAAQRHPAVVKLLIERGADVNARSNVEVPPVRGRGSAVGAARNNDTPAAAPRGNPPACPQVAPRPAQVFGVAGPTVRTKATGGGCISALILAARENDPESVRILLESGANVNLTMNDGTTALIVAIMSGHYDIASFLLDKGADPNIADGKGMAALYATVHMRNLPTTDVPQVKADDAALLKLIRKVLDHGANANARLSAKLPYRGGTDPTWQSEVGATPFLRAAYSNDIVLMRILLAYGADPQIPASDKTTPLMAAAGVGWLPNLVYTRNENLVETLKLCLELGNDIHAINDGKPNSGGPFGVTALHGAAFKGLPEGIQFLVDNGARVDAQDAASTVGGARGVGRTPLDYAEGIYFQGQPPRREEKAVVLLKKLMAAAK